MAMHVPPVEIRMQVAIAWHPRWWALLPRLESTPPAGWRGGFSFTFLILNVQRWWRYV